MSQFPKKGYLYVISGSRKYHEEALTSLESLRAVDPEAHITLITDKGSSDADRYRRQFDHVVAVEERVDKDIGWKEALLFRVRHLYELSPYKLTFFLDSDTYFIENCRCLFDILRYYDMALAHGANDRNNARVEGEVLEGYTPYNMGVILFKKGETTQDFFERWLRTYTNDLERLPHDQPAAMEALALSDCRVYVLQNNWNARFVFVEKYVDRVRLLHGRHEDLGAVARSVNNTSWGRLWIPKFDACIRKKMRAEEALKACWFILKQAEYKGFANRVYRYIVRRLTKRLNSESTTDL